MLPKVADKSTNQRYRYHDAFIVCQQLSTKNQKTVSVEQPSR